MKFLLISSYADSLIKFRGSLISELISRGIEVHVVAPEDSYNDSIVASLKSMGVTWHSVRMERTGTSLLKDISTLFQLISLMKRIRPQMVLAYTIKPILYGIIAAKISGVKDRFSLITGLGYAFQERSAFFSLKSLVLALVKCAYSLSLRLSKVVFVQNNDDIEYLRKIRVLSKNTPTILVNGSGVDVTEFSPVPHPHELSFLLIARLLKCKGIVEYAEAAKQVRREFPNLKFYLVGWLDENPDSISSDELKKWTSDGDITYLGRLSDVRPAISNCSVYVLPSYREGLPRTVIEAMAMGRAVITTDAPGCRSTVENEVNGFIVPVADVNGLVDAMRKFALDDSLVKRMGDKARQYTELHFDVKKVNNVMLKGMGVI